MNQVKRSKKKMKSKIVMKLIWNNICLFNLNQNKFNLLNNRKKILMNNIKNLKNNKKRKKDKKKMILRNF